MQRIRTMSYSALLCVLVVWGTTGCENTTDADAPNDIATRTQVINLDDAYGGYNTADEAPAFDDPYLRAMYGPDAANFALAGGGADSTLDRRLPHRFLLVTWGNLRADSTIDFATDWTGSLCVENGFVRPLRTIRFEPGDHLVLPPSSRHCVEWVSHTRPSFDGVLVSLHRMPCDSLVSVAAVADSLCGDQITVTFSTGPLTVSFTQDEIKDLHKVIPVDNAGNAVAFNTLVLMPGDCPTGFLAGQWKKVEGERYAGIFRGQWVSENGLHEGFLRGVYGANGRGENVFFGKWISENGRFRGLLKGRYGRNPAVAAVDDTVDGWFAGVWFSRQLRVGGELKGVWGEGEKEGEGGYFRGAWAAHCRR
jgi:hypothetical protein